MSQHNPEVRHPQVVFVSVGALREFRRLADPDLSPGERAELAQQVAAAIDHLIARAEEAGWPL